MPTTRNRDETGNQYGRLTVLCRGLDDTDYVKCWICMCDCGKVVVVRQLNLRNGHTRSCGCFHRERSKEGLFGHGECKPETREYRAWKAMKSRCYNQKHKYYANYGGRGITVCPQWLNSYPNFLADVGRAPSPAHTMGRKDNAGNYEPGNVEWETREEQNNNKRNNHLVTVGDKTRTVTEWALKYGIARSTFLRRLDRGMFPAEAIQYMSGRTGD
jgi:hypothetical protein